MTGFRGNRRPTYDVPPRTPKRHRAKAAGPLRASDLMLFVAVLVVLLTTATAFLFRVL